MVLAVKASGGGRSREAARREADHARSAFLHSPLFASSTQQKVAARCQLHRWKKRSRLARSLACCLLLCSVCVCCSDPAHAHDACAQSACLLSNALSGASEHDGRESLAAGRGRRGVQRGEQRSQQRQRRDRTRCEQQQQLPTTREHKQHHNIISDINITTRMLPTRPSERTNDRRSCRETTAFKPSAASKSSNPRRASLLRSSIQVVLCNRIAWWWWDACATRHHSSCSADSIDCTIRIAQSLPLACLRLLASPHLVARRRHE